MYSMTAVDERCGVLGGIILLGSAGVNGGEGRVAVCRFFVLLVSVGETRWIKIVQFTVPPIELYRIQNTLTNPIHTILITKT